MRKGLLFLIAVGFVSLVQAKILCFNYGDSLTTNTCLLVKKTFERMFPHDDFEMKNISEIKEKRFYAKIIYIAGYGQPEKGFWLDKRGLEKINWCKILENLNAYVLLIDSCYSGKIFECQNKRIPIIISSTTGNCVSVNNIVNGKPYSTFSLMLACLVGLFPECEKIKGCNFPFSPQVCQLGWILLKHNWSNQTLEFLLDFPDLHPNICLGTTLFNGKPWK